MIHIQIKENPRKFSKVPANILVFLIASTFKCSKDAITRHLDVNCYLVHTQINDVLRL